MYTSMAQHVNTELTVTSLDVNIMNSGAPINSHVMLKWSDDLKKYFGEDEGDGSTPRAAALNFIDDELIWLGNIGDQIHDEPIMGVYKRCLKKLKKRLIVFREFVQTMSKIDDNKTFWTRANNFIDKSLELVGHNLKLIKCYWRKKKGARYECYEVG